MVNQLPSGSGTPYAPDHAVDCDEREIETKRVMEIEARRSFLLRGFCYPGQQFPGGHLDKNYLQISS